MRTNASRFPGGIAVIVLLDEDQADEHAHAPIIPVRIPEQDPNTRRAESLPEPATLPGQQTTGPEQTIRYELPGPPTTERRVVDRLGAVWLRELSGMFACELLGPNELPSDDPLADHVNPGARWRWVQLLDKRGPLELMALTPAEQYDAELYGPPGGRWGNPRKPCPHPACMLGLHHAGLHKDTHGAYVQPADPDGTTTTANVTREDMDRHCTCGDPAEHAPDCPRYPRMFREETQP